MEDSIVEEIKQEEVKESGSVRLWFEEMWWYIKVNGSLLIGLLLTIGGLLNISSERYCDGTTATYHTCTNSSVYYEYTGPVIASILVGVILITLWYLKQRDSRA